MRDVAGVQDRKPLPHDVVVEQELLGAIMMHNSLMPLVQGMVKEQHFYEPLHQQMFQVASQLIAAGKPATPTTMGAFMPKDVTVGGEPLRKYFAAMVAAAAPVAHAPEFARIVKDLFDYREIILLTERMTSLRDSVDPSEIATAAIEELGRIVEDRSTIGAKAVDMNVAVARAVDAAALAYQNDGKPRGLQYGWWGLDNKTLGAKGGELIVIAGRPGMGKSAFALGALRNQALDGKRGYLYSPEMIEEDMATRMLADHIWQLRRRLTYWQIASGKFQEEHFKRVTEAAREVGKLPIKLDPTPGLTVAEIGMRARQYMRKHGELHSLWVDHIGLVKASARYAGNKVYETGEITQGLKALAKDLKIPVFALCQITRGVDQRDDKRPQMSDLRNSGDIEQDADTILMLYRPAYYEAKKEPQAGTMDFNLWAERMAAIENRLDCIVEKQRSGPTGTVRLHIDIGCNAVREEITEMDDELPISNEDARSLL